MSRLESDNSGEETGMSQGEHEIRLYRRNPDGVWDEFGVATGCGQEGFSRSDAIEGLTDLIRSHLENIPLEGRPLLHQVVAVAEVPPFGEIAVDGFGREMKEIQE